MNHRIKATQNISRHCMVCGVENEFGLKARFYETEKTEVIAVFTPRDVHQSSPHRTRGRPLVASPGTTAASGRGPVSSSYRTAPWRPPASASI